MNDWTYKLLAGLFIVGFVFVIGYIIKFEMTHDCVRNHQETRYQTICNKVGNMSICNSSPYQTTVCDEWVEKK